MDLCHIEIVTSEKDVPSSFESVAVSICVCVVCVVRVCVSCCIMCLRRGNSGRKGKHFKTIITFYSKLFFFLKFSLIFLSFPAFLPDGS